MEKLFTVTMPSGITYVVEGHRVWRLKKDGTKGRELHCHHWAAAMVRIAARKVNQGDQPIDRKGVAGGYLNK